MYCGKEEIFLIEKFGFVICKLQIMIASCNRGKKHYKFITTDQGYYKHLDHNAEEPPV